MNKKFFYAFLFISLGILILQMNTIRLIGEIEIIQKFWAVLLVLFGLLFISKNRIVNNIILAITGTFSGVLIYSLLYN